MAKGRHTANKNAMSPTVKTMENGEAALAINVIKKAITDYVKLHKTISKATKELEKVVKFIKGETFEFYCALVGNIDADACRDALFDKFGGEAKFRTIEYWDEILANALAKAGKGGTDDEKKGEK